MSLVNNKYYLFASYMFVILFFILFFTMYTWAKRSEKSGFRILLRVRLNIADWAVLVFATITLLSAALTPYNSYFAFWGLPTRRDGAATQLLYIAVYFIVSRWYKPRENDFVFFSASAILVALIGVFQFYGMDFFGLGGRHISAVTADGAICSYNTWYLTTIGNINFVSTYACMAILLCGFLFVRHNSKLRYVWLSGSALNLWLLIMTSYSGMVGTLAAMVLAIPFITQSKKYLGRFFILASSFAAVLFLHRLFYNTLVLGAATAAELIILAALMLLLAAAGLSLSKAAYAPQPDAPVKWKRGVILIAVCIIAGLAGILIFGGSDSAGPVYQAREILRGNVQDDFGTHRIHIWRNALRAVPQRPLIGSGPDSFYYAFPRDAQGVFNEYYDKAHNEYVQILVCQGILGLLSYLVFLGTVFIKAVPKAFRNPLIMPVLAAFTGYCIQAFFNISLPIVGQFLWVFAGLVANKNVIAGTLGRV